MGGGLGINPLFSILQHHTWLLQQTPRLEGGSGVREGGVQLLFSAKSVSELLFKVSDARFMVYNIAGTGRLLLSLFMQGHIDRICATHTNIDAHYFVTQEEISQPGIACECHYL